MKSPTEIAREIMERFFVKFGEISSSNRDKEAIIAAYIQAEREWAKILEDALKHITQPSKCCTVAIDEDREADHYILAASEALKRYRGER